MLGTATKVALARMISTTLVRLGVRTRRQIRRTGVIFEVDIREGIDLSLFLFGSFERDVLADGPAKHQTFRFAIFRDHGDAVGNGVLRRREL